MTVLIKAWSAFISLTISRWRRWREEGITIIHFEASVKPGAKGDKGDPLGYFLFGGSDVIMISAGRRSFP